jgi:hypothetical protein
MLAIRWEDGRNAIHFAHARRCPRAQRYRNFGEDQSGILDKAAVGKAIQRRKRCHDKTCPFQSGTIGLMLGNRTIHVDRRAVHVRAFAIGDRGAGAADDGA